MEDRNVVTKKNALGHWLAGGGKKRPKKPKRPKK